jgi:hypothetical protein
VVDGALFVQFRLARLEKNGHRPGRGARWMNSFRISDYGPLVLINSKKPALAAGKLADGIAPKILVPLESV